MTPLGRDIPPTITYATPAAFSAAMTWSGSHVGSVIWHASDVSEPQGGAADLDRQSDALRWHHPPMAVDRFGVVPGLAPLRGEGVRRIGHDTKCGTT